MKTRNKKTQVQNAYQQFSALLWKEDDWYVAKAVEVEIASQGKTKKKALANLQEALELYFEEEPIAILPAIKDITLEKVHISYA